MCKIFNYKNVIKNKFREKFEIITDKEGLKRVGPSRTLKFLNLLGYSYR